MCSRTIGRGFTDRFVVSQAAGEATERHFLIDDRLYTAT